AGRYTCGETIAYVRVMGRNRDWRELVTWPGWVGAVAQGVSVWHPTAHACRRREHGLCWGFRQPRMTMSIDADDETAVCDLELPRQPRGQPFQPGAFIHRFP